jgi:hypothetical protein
MKGYLNLVQPSGTAIAGELCASILWPYKVRCHMNPRKYCGKPPLSSIDPPGFSYKRDHFDRLFASNVV